MQEWLWELISEPLAHQESIKMSFTAFIRLLHSSFLWSDSVHKWRRHCLGCQENENLWYNFSKRHKSMQRSSLPEECCICLLHYIKAHLFYIDQYFQAIVWVWGGKKLPPEVSMNIWEDFCAQAVYESWSYALC